MNKQTIGAFKVGACYDPMCAGHFLNVVMPSGRVVVIYDQAVEPEHQGGESVLEVWANEDNYDSGEWENPGNKQIGF